MSFSMCSLRQRLSSGRVVRFMMLATALILLGAGNLKASQSLPAVVATYDFEDNTAGGWGSFYGASTPAATNAAAYTGTYSLLTSTSSTGTGGPSINLSTVLQPGATYTITGWVKLASGATSANANFSAVRVDSSGTNYDTIGGYQVAVTDSGWAQIGGSYTPSASSTSLTLYSQLVGATTAVGFYLDDVVITETVAPPAGNTVATYTFAGSTDGWWNFGTATLAATTGPGQDPEMTVES